MLACLPFVNKTHASMPSCWIKPIRAMMVLSSGLNILRLMPWTRRSPVDPESELVDRPNPNGLPPELTARIDPPDEIPGALGKHLSKISPMSFSQQLEVKTVHDPVPPVTLHTIRDHGNPHHGHNDQEKWHFSFSCTLVERGKNYKLIALRKQKQFRIVIPFDCAAGFRTWRQLRGKRSVNIKSSMQTWYYVNQKPHNHFLHIQIMHARRNT